MSCKSLKVKDKVDVSKGQLSVHSMNGVHDLLSVPRYLEGLNLGTDGGAFFNTLTWSVGTWALVMHPRPRATGAFEHIRWLALSSNERKDFRLCPYLGSSSAPQANTCNA